MELGVDIIVQVDSNDTIKVVLGPFMVVLLVARCARSLPIPTLGQGSLMVAVSCGCDRLPEDNRRKYLGGGKNFLTKTHTQSQTIV